MSPSGTHLPLGQSKCGLHRHVLGWILISIHLLDKALGFVLHQHFLAKYASACPKGFKINSPSQGKGVWAGGGGKRWKRKGWGKEGLCLLLCPRQFPSPPSSIKTFGSCAPPSAVPMYTPSLGKPGSSLMAGPQGGCWDVLETDRLAAGCPQGAWHMQSEASSPAWGKYVLLREVPPWA